MKLTGLTPMLETGDVAGTVKFYTELLGFRCTGQWQSPARAGSR
jgi:catechol 2,3-dioxygenase-like lactoylglutathione lyase family enzyme